MAEREIKPIWNSSSFLVYTGGLTVLLGAGAGLGYLASQYHGHGTQAAWTLFFLVIIYGVAHALRVRDRWLAAGIFAFVSVLVWAALVWLTMRWIGWHPFSVYSYRSQLGGWSWSRVLLWVLILAAAWYDRRLFKFPFIRLISAVVFWAFLADLLTSGHGTWFAVVSLLTGLFYLMVGNVIDKPSAFWLHLVSGALIGGPFLYWFHKGDGDYAMISIVALVFVLIAYWTRRSSWAVFGALGFFLASGHYVTGAAVGLLPPYAGLASSTSCIVSANGMPVCTSNAPWAPALAYGLLGFFLVALGMLGKRKKGHNHGAVVVKTAAEPLAE